MAGENIQECISDPSPERDINDTAKSNERRLCPLCQSPIRLFYINFNDKFLMCENVYCEFPYGYEELKFVKADEEMSDEDCFSFKTRIKAMSECDTNLSSTGTSGKAFNEIGENKDLEFIVGSKTTDYKAKIMKTNKEEELLKNINDIKKLNDELITLNEELDSDEEEEKAHITKKKWIKDLKALHDISGSLLKPEETEVLKKMEPEIGLGELKLNIIPGGNSYNMPEIRIEVHNPNPVNDIPSNSKMKPCEGKGKRTLPM